MFDRRTNARHDIQVPVTIGGSPAGVTRDVSVNGVYFRSPLDLSPGATVEFSLHFPSVGNGGYRVDCIGRVVRREAGGGVAAAVGQIKFSAERFSGSKAAI